MTAIDIRKGMFDEELQELENDLTPFGFISSHNNGEEDTILDDDGIWKSAKK
jgi:hypothetical protein